MKPAVTRVFMVRHGATVSSAEDRFAGATDVALSDEGREQTRRLADRLSHEKIMAVYASPLGRTVETAQILAGPHKLEVQACDGFRAVLLEPSPKLQFQETMALLAASTAGEVK